MEKMPLQWSWRGPPWRGRMPPRLFGNPTGLLDVPMPLLLPHPPGRQVQLPAQRVPVLLVVRRRVALAAAHKDAPGRTDDHETLGGAGAALAALAGTREARNPSDARRPSTSAAGLAGGIVASSQGHHAPLERRRAGGAAGGGLARRGGTLVLAGYGRGNRTRRCGRPGRRPRATAEPQTVGRRGSPATRGLEGRGLEGRRRGDGSGAWPRPGRPRVGESERADDPPQLAPAS